MSGTRTKAIVAWVGTAALLVYLGFTTNLDEAFEAVRSADAALFLSCALVAVPVMWITDSLSAHGFLRRLGFEVRFREFAPVRGAGYLLSNVNYGLMLALMTTVVARRSERGLGASGGAFLLLGLVDIGALSLTALAGLAFWPSPLGPGPTALLATAAVSGVLAAPLGALACRRLAAVTGGPLGRLGRLSLLAPFRDVPVRLLLETLPIRLLLVLEQLTMDLVFLWAFGFSVGPREVLVFMPILGMIAVLPITVAGLGSTQLVARGLFGPFAPAGVAAIAAVDAVSTSSILGVMAVRSIFGLLCLPWALRAGAPATAVDPRPPPP